MRLTYTKVIDGTGVVSTAQNGNLYDFKSLGGMSDKELTKWAASNVVDIEFKAAASSTGHYHTAVTQTVTKAELLYYFASICNPDEVIAEDPPGITEGGGGGAISYVQNERKMKTHKDISEGFIFGGVML